MAQNIEDFIPPIQSSGLNTLEDTSLGGTLAVTGNTTIGGTLGVTGATTFTGAVTLNGGRSVGIVNGVAPTTATTLTLAQSGSVVLWNSSTGILYTLPAPTPGLTYTLVVSLAATTGTHGIQTNNTSGTYFYGGIVMGAGSAGTFSTNGTAATGIRMNGTTSGGSVGTVINLVATSTGAWSVSGQVIGSGVQATPFTTG